MARPLRLLLVEDSEDDARLIVRHLERLGYAVDAVRADTPARFAAALDDGVWDVVVSDHSLPQFNSMDALRTLQARDLDYPFIIVSGTIGEDAAVEAMRAGADDYVLKDDLARLAPAIARELDDAAGRRQARDERAARHAVERQLQQAQKMEAVGRLAGGVAHDFNNLLTAILGFTSLALERIGEGRDVRGELGQVKDAAERAARFTRQLLAFSRQQVLAPRIVDPAAIVETMAPLLRQLLGEHIQLETPPAADAPRVRVDPGQFEQVVMNLAVNARDAMPGGGRLTIEVGRAEVAERDAERLALTPGPHAVVAVSDSGTGMDERTRARIFEPFFTTKAPGQGTGLGLSTVYGILQQSGGAIGVDSRPGKGSTFRVYLPMAQGALAASADPPPAAAAHRGRATILVAEDEAAVRTLITTVLRGAGFDVLEAASGTDAAGMLDRGSGPIDLLITDVVMPGLVGPDLARLVVGRFREARVLYMTGYATHPAVPPSFMAADDVLLQKPFTPEDLLARVHARLGRVS